MSTPTEPPRGPTPYLGDQSPLPGPPRSFSSAPARALSAASRGLNALGERIENRTVLEGIVRWIAKQMNKLGDRLENRADTSRVGGASAQVRDKQPAWRTAAAGSVKWLADKAASGGDRLESRAARPRSQTGLATRIRRAVARTTLRMSEGLQQISKRLDPPEPTFEMAQVPTHSPPVSAAPGPPQPSQRPESTVFSPAEAADIHNWISALGSFGPDVPTPPTPSGPSFAPFEQKTTVDRHPASGPQSSTADWRYSAGPSVAETAALRPSRTPSVTSSVASTTATEAPRTTPRTPRPNTPRRSGR